MFENIWQGRLDGEELLFHRIFQRVKEEIITIIFHRMISFYMDLL
jgi:hypothetical protein